MKTLDDIKEWLQAIPEKNRIDVYDPKKDRLIDRGMSIAEMDQQNGSFDDYFKSLSKKYDSVTVQRSVKYGSSFHRKGSPQLFRFQDGERSATIPEKKPPMKQHDYMASPGLGLPDYIQASNKAALLEEIKRQKDKAENKCELLERQLDELKGERDKLRNDKDAKPDPIIDLLGKAIESGQASQLVATFMQRKNGGLPAGSENPGATGLSMPETLSAVKKQLIEVVKSEHVDDRTAQEAYNVIAFVLDGNQEFITDYQALVKKYADGNFDPN